MRVRFLADANFNQRIVAGLLLREPQIDFALPQDLIPAGTKDPKVLELGALLGRIIVTHDVRTMPTISRRSRVSMHVREWFSCQHGRLSEMRLKTFY